MQRPKSDEFEALLSEHGKSVWRLVVRILGNDGDDAADCFQQAFVELVSRQRRLNDVREARLLLSRIATARAIDAVRRRIRERGRSQPVDATAIASSPILEPDAQAETTELLDDLRAALAEIPADQSAAFVLTQFDDFSHDEAAEAIGVTVNHLGVLLCRARAALRERLQSHKPVRKTWP